MRVTGCFFFVLLSFLAHSAHSYLNLHDHGRIRRRKSSSMTLNTRTVKSATSTVQSTYSNTFYGAHSSSPALAFGRKKPKVLSSTSVKNEYYGVTTIDTPVAFHRENHTASDAVQAKYYGLRANSQAVHQTASLQRAGKIFSVVSGGILAPLILSLKDGSVDNDWDAFWARRIQGMSNADRVTKAVEQLGPTFVKFGQALSTRPDVVPPVLAQALSVLQDQMQPFDTATAREIIRTEVGDTCFLFKEELENFMESLSPEPVAAASIGQVYSGMLPNYGKVAVKVQRPGVSKMVRNDAVLLRSIARWIESLPGPPGQQRKLVAAKLTDAVDEFMSRVAEELDYRNEVTNMKTFASLYSRRSGSSDYVKVVVPQVWQDFCTDHVIVMEWIEGTKLNSVEVADDTKENLALVELGIDCTLSQLLDVGVMHVDPHTGNLLKVRTDEGVQLGYLDFGILSTVPEKVRDGLVCAVAHLVFARDVEAVANLFAQLQLLPKEVLEDKEERAALTKALNQTFLEVLQYPAEDSSTRGVPVLRFDNLLGSLAGLVTRFQFELPKYFLNNARALGTLEGLARTLDPSFNVLRIVYPYALNRILNNPSASHAVEETLLGLTRNPETGRFELRRLLNIIDDAALGTGYSRRRVISDILKSKGGRWIIRCIVAEQVQYRLAFSRKKQTDMMS